MKRRGLFDDYIGPWLGVLILIVVLGAWTFVLAALAYGAKTP